MLSLKPRPFVQSSFDMQEPSFCLFGHVPFSEYFFCTISALSLYGEYAVRSLLPSGVFLPCDHELDFWHQLIFVDSHVLQRIVLVTAVETTVTQKNSHRPNQMPITFVCGHKEVRLYNSLFRPTGIQIATKSYATLQAMAPTNIKTVH